MAHPRAITLADFEELQKVKGIYLLDFWASWCGPCRVMNPIIEKLMEDPELKEINFLSVDVDAQPELSGMFRVTSIPTFYLIKIKGEGSFNKETDTLNKIIGASPAFDFKMQLLNGLKKSQGEDQPST